MISEDALDRSAGDPVPKIAEGSADPGVTPPRIVDCHSHDKLRDLGGRHRPSRTSASATVVLLGDQLAVPAKDGVGRDDAGHLCQRTPSQLPSSNCESTALHVGQPQSSTAELLAQDTILRAEVVDEIFLAAVEPPSDGQHEESESVRHRQRLRRIIRRLHDFWASQRFGEVFVPYGGEELVRLFPTD